MAINAIKMRVLPRPCGLVGFSMGGYTVLRIESTVGLASLVVCPTLQPAQTMAAIDASALYRFFFVRKWQRAIRQKLAAFPDYAVLAEALNLHTMKELTEHCVRYLTPYSSTAAFFDSYTLSLQQLHRSAARILYAQDDPVVSADGFRSLHPTLDLHPLKCGGHCAFVETVYTESWLDRYVAAYFEQVFCG